VALEAANDLGDDATIEACRRVIDANLSGALAPRPICISSSITSGDDKADLNWESRPFGGFRRIFAQSHLDPNMGRSESASDLS